MSFWKFFRLLFVFFFLYLLGDAFYRWDAFSYYATLSEFLPSVALISVQWIIVTAITAIIIWLLLNVTIFICKCIRFKVSVAHLLLNVGIFVSIALITFNSKKMMFPDLQTSAEEKLIVAVSVVLLALFITWLLRNKAADLLDMIAERITPLVWLFGIIVGISIPVVTYYALWEPSGKTITERAAEVQGDDGDRPNIVLVTYDSLTSRNMSVYGYHRDTTPFITEWAESATVFEKCEAASNTTSQTTASLVTGKRVWTHRRYQSDAGQAARIDTESFPLLLKNSGYYNMAFIANDIASVKTLGMSDSFHVMPSPSEMMEPASLTGFLHKNLVKYFGSKIKLYDWILKPDFILGVVLHVDRLRYPSRNQFPVEKVFDMFLKEIDDNALTPYFAWIHVYPPHAPYLPPEPYMGMFEPSPKYRTAKSQYALINPRYFTREQQRDADIVMGRYDEFIRYCDKQFEYLINKLSAISGLENTVVILSSDHGESFTHGYFTHGSHFLNEEMTHIPLIIKRLDQSEGRIIDFPVEQTDISATILDLAGIPVPSWMDGRSLGPALRGEEFQPVPVFSMNLEAVHMLGQQEISKGIFAVWQSDYKLIYYPTAETSLLFNLKLDPNEQNNLFNSEAEVGQRLLGLIQDNINKVNKRFNGENIYQEIN